MSNCKECPWVNKTENNLKFIGYAKRHNKTHNCHMISPSKRGVVWDTKEDCICVGSKNWSLNQNKDDDEDHLNDCGDANEY